MPPVAFRLCLPLLAGPRHLDPFCRPRVSPALSEALFRIAQNLIQVHGDHEAGSLVLWDYATGHKRYRLRSRSSEVRWESRPNESSSPANSLTCSRLPGWYVRAMPAGVPSDTHPTVETFILDGYRRMSPAEKIARVTALTQTVQRLALADIRRRYPTATMREQSLRLASRWLGPDLMRKAFGWDVEKEGL
jgi:hypothetical protein